MQRVNAAVLATASLSSAYAYSQTYDPATDVTTIDTGQQVINHFEYKEYTYACPPDHLLVPQGTDFIGDVQYYQPIASAGVTFAATTIGNVNLLGPGSVNVAWMNWNLTGDQTFEAVCKCTGNLDPPAVTTTTTLPAPVTSYTTSVSLANFQAAFVNGLPQLGGGPHRDPSAGLLQGVQTPPDVAALGRHLVRTFAKPEVIKPDEDLTLIVACPSGGLVTADPGVRSAEPYISRVTSLNVWTHSPTVTSASIRWASSSPTRALATKSPPTSSCAPSPTSAASLYWLTRAGASAARLYWESIEQVTSWLTEPGSDIVRVPTGCSVFVAEVPRPSRRWAARRYPDIRYWAEHDHGGHFAALEAPDLLIDDIRAFFRQIRDPRVTSR